MEPREKPRERAAALRYVPEKDRAPKVVAKGSGAVAEKIIELARKHGVPVKEDPVLIEILAQLDLFQEIPPAVYSIVAEILAFIYSVNREKANLSAGKTP